MKNVFSGSMLQLRFGPYTILAWTAKSVNCHIASQSHVLFVN